MKNLLGLILMVQLIIGCSFNTKETFVIDDLNQFDSREENAQLGIDIMNYRFGDFLKQDHPEFSQELLNSITYQVVNKKPDNVESFNLTLLNKAVDHQTEIIQLFKKHVAGIISSNQQNKELFNKAINAAEISLTQLDNYNFNSFWKNSGPQLTHSVTLDEFIKIIGDRKSFRENSGPRFFYSKQFYSNFPKHNIPNIIVISFGYQNYPYTIESITFELKNNHLYIIGHKTSKPN